MTTQKVRDFSGGEHTFSIELDHSPVYELLLRLFVVGDEDCLEFEMGDQLSSALEVRASATLTKDLKALGNAGEVWICLIPLAYEVGYTGIQEFIDHIESMDAIELRTRLLDCSWVEADEQPAQSKMDAAAAGDMDAVQELAGMALAKAKHEGLRYLLAMEPERTKSMMAEVLRRFASEVFTEADELAPLLARDAEEKAALASRLPADRAIEIATNGITVEVGPDTSGVVLIPAFSARPWVIITEAGTRKILCYGVSDDLEEDPDAPPFWVVKFYKALGDERRLRILGVLREGPSSLTDLAQRLELSKSTIHHHLGMLRDAGLVRVTLGKEKGYSLRTDAVPQAGQLLEAYLSPATTPGGTT
jgi:DNA-binding transcriptional ArsR family regulator